MKIISIDIGGTNTRVASISDNKIVKIIKFKTKRNFDEEVKFIIKSINELCFPYEGIGISAPGPADYGNGTFLSLPNLPEWNGKNLFHSLRKELGDVIISMNNDANLMALAHHNYFKNFDGITQFFTVSTGLGAGLIINNSIFTGTNYLAQEIACAPLAFSKEKGKGLTAGALEYFSSGSGIEARANMQSIEAFNQYNKDKKITQIIDDGIDTLANAIACSISFIAPNLVVFDGSIARNNAFYIDKAWELAKTRMFKEHVKIASMKIGELGDDAALLGAFQLVSKVIEKKS